MQLGTLFGVSVGPGDPELITVKGLRLLQNVNIVAFPAGVQGKSGMAEIIVNQWLQSHQLKLPLDFPYVQDEQILTQSWENAAKKIWQYLKIGEDVVFVSEGDVSFYSTFTYLAQSLLKLYPHGKIQTIPGVSSPLAVAAILGIPLTIKAQKLIVLPAIYSMGELEKALDLADVLVLMKVSSVYQEVWNVLAQRNLLTSSYIVEKATLPDMILYEGLSDRAYLKLPYFSLLIVKITD